MLMGILWAHADTIGCIGLSHCVHRVYRIGHCVQLDAPYRLCQLIYKLLVEHTVRTYQPTEVRGFACPEVALSTSKFISERLVPRDNSPRTASKAEGHILEGISVFSGES